MKYKLLGIEELSALEPEFIHFLASAQITGPDWEKMKKNKPEQAHELIEVFSDMVYEKVVSKIKFLEYRDEKTLNIYHCMDDKIQLLGIRVKEQSALNLADTGFFEKWNDQYKNELGIVKSEKRYTTDRGVEVFELLETGCLLTDNKLYDLINNLF
jgi:hypothetical protein